MLSDWRWFLLRGAESLYREQGIAYIAVPGTIDNDLPGTDYTIGFDTAMNTIIEAVNKIRDTATSMRGPLLLKQWAGQAAILRLWLDWPVVLMPF